MEKKKPLSAYMALMFSFRVSYIQCAVLQRAALEPMVQVVIGDQHSMLQLMGQWTTPVPLVSQGIVPMVIVDATATLHRMVTLVLAQIPAAVEPRTDSHQHPHSLGHQCINTRELNISIGCWYFIEFLLGCISPRAWAFWWAYSGSDVEARKWNGVCRCVPKTAVAVYFFPPLGFKVYMKSGSGVHVELSL